MHQGYGGHLHPKVEIYGPAVVPRKTGREAKAPPHRWLWQDIVVALHVRATRKRETPDSDEESDVLRMAGSGVNARGRQAMLPNPGVEGVPSVGEPAIRRKSRYCRECKTALKARPGFPELRTSQYLSGAGGLLPSMASISARTSGVNFPLSLSAERLSSSWLFFEAPRITVETFGLARHQSSAR